MPKTPPRIHAAARGSTATRFGCGYPQSAGIGVRKTDRSVAGCPTRLSGYYLAAQVFVFLDAASGTIFPGP